MSYAFKVWLRQVLKLLSESATDQTVISEGQDITDEVQAFINGVHEDAPLGDSQYIIQTRAYRLTGEPNSYGLYNVDTYRADLYSNNYRVYEKADLIFDRRTHRLVGVRMHDD